MPPPNNKEACCQQHSNHVHTGCDSSNILEGDRVVTVSTSMEVLGGVVCYMDADSVCINQDVPVGCTPKIFSLPRQELRKVTGAEREKLEREIAAFVKEYGEAA